jgi:hypothetical protein
MIFQTSLDKLAKIITIATTILFVFVIGVQFVLFEAEEFIPFLTVILLLAIYLIAVLFRPLNYNLTTNHIIINRPLTRVKIDRNEIKSIERISDDKLDGTIRTFGIGGLFGYWGNFANAKIGKMTWYATRRNHAILIQTVTNKKIILTPDEPEKFISAFYQ